MPIYVEIETVDAQEFVRQLIGSQSFVRSENWREITVDEERELFYNGVIAWGPGLPRYEFVESNPAGTRFIEQTDNRFRLRWFQCDAAGDEIAWEMAPHMLMVPSAGDVYLRAELLNRQGVRAVGFNNIGYFMLGDGSVMTLAFTSGLAEVNQIGAAGVALKTIRVHQLHNIVSEPVEFYAETTSLL